MTTSEAQADVELRAIRTTMTSGIRIISSMATRKLLANLVAAYAGVSPESTATVESVGGVDAARRVDAGEAFDAVVLASGAVDKLIASGSVLTGSRVDLVQSPVALAVRTGHAGVDMSTEDAVKQAVLGCRSIGYSTGPSGDHLLRLFARWGISDALAGRIVQAPPGVPVASLVARGDAELGFQQLSELMNVEDVEVVGVLPDVIQSVTTFSGGVTRASAQAEGVRAMLAFMASPRVAGIKRRHGMEPA